MTSARFSVDTNILVYSVDRDSGHKHELAVALLDALAEHDCVIALQALAEFFHVATRKGHVPPAEAMEIVSDWSVLFPVVAADGRHLKSAMEWVEQGVFSFWDGMLFATARMAGVNRFVTEDMQHGFELGGTRVVDPFHADFADDVLAVLNQ